MEVTSILEYILIGLWKGGVCLNQPKVNVIDFPLYKGSSCVLLSFVQQKTEFGL